MSQDNVDIVRRYFELVDGLLADYWEKHVPLDEYERIDEAFEDVAPDAEWEPPTLTDAPLRGREAWLAAIADFIDAADHWRIHIEDVSDLGGENVLVTSRNAIRGKGSGIEIDQGIFTVVRVEDGKIKAIRDFTEREAAIEYAGTTGTA